MKDKNLAKQEYLEMIQKSWTWGKLDQVERKKFLDLIEHPCASAIIKVSYEQRWDACEAIYHTFLEGLGYQPIGWRDAQPSKSTHFELSYKTCGDTVPPLNMTNEVQAKRLYQAAKADSRNTNVKLARVDIIVTPMEVK